MSARDDFPLASDFITRDDPTEAPFQRHVAEALDTIDRLRAIKASDDGLICPSVDVCAFCGDSECDGMGCIQSLDPNDELDQPYIEQIQSWVRLGRIQEQANAFLAVVENRT